MTITIEDSLFADLRQVAEQRGEDPDRFAAGVLRKAVREHQADAVSSADPDEDADLTDADHLAIRDGIRRGLDAAAAGRLRPFSEFAAEQRAQYDLPQ